MAAFWNLILEPGKEYIRTVQYGIHVSKAILDISKDVENSAPVQVLLKYNGKTFPVANLSTKHSVFQTSMDLSFNSGDEVQFKLSSGAKASVTLTGVCSMEVSSDEEDSGDEEGLANLVDGEEVEDEEDLIDYNPEADLSEADDPCPDESQLLTEETTDDDEEESGDSSQEDSDEEENDTTAQGYNSTMSIGDEDSDEEEEDSDDDLEEEEESDEDGDEDMEDSDVEIEEPPTKKKKLDASVKPIPVKKEKSKKKLEEVKPVAKTIEVKSKNKGTPNPKKTETPKPKKVEAVPKETTPKSKKSDSVAKSKKETPKQLKKDIVEKENVDVQTPKSAKKNKNKSKNQADTPKQQKPKALQGGVLVEEKQIGSGAEIKDGAVAQVYYKGYFKGKPEKVFDSALSGPPFKFRIGKSEVIKGWDVGVKGMKVGGKRKITCPPHMAYGKAGVPPTIPPNSFLEFEIQLMGFK